MANNNGLRLLRTCVDHDLVVTNTFFKHPDAHTATWLSPGGRYWATKDYILVNRPFWPSVRDTRVMPNALTHDSDHSMVVCDIRLRLTNTALRGQRIPLQPRICVASLNDPTKLHAFQAAVRQAAADRLRTPLPPQLTGAQAREVTLAVAAAITAAGIKHLGLEPRRRRGRLPLKESTKQLCDDKRAAYHTWHALKLQYEQQVLGGMEGAQLEVHLVAATMARERYIDLKKLSRRAIDHDVEEGMEAKAEQAGNLAHDRNDREAFRLVGELSGNKSGGHLQAVSEGGGYFVGQKQRTRRRPTSRHRLTTLLHTSRCSARFAQSRGRSICSVRPRLPMSCTAVSIHVRWGPWYSKTHTKTT